MFFKAQFNLAGEEHSSSRAILDTHVTKTRRILIHGYRGARVMVHATGEGARVEEVVWNTRARVRQEVVIRTSGACSSRCAKSWTNLPSLNDWPELRVCSLLDMYEELELFGGYREFGLCSWKFTKRMIQCNDFKINWIVIIGFQCLLK